MHQRGGSFDVLRHFVSCGGLRMTAGIPSPSLPHLLENHIDCSLIAARIRFIDPVHVLLDRPRENEIVSAFYFSRFLVAEEGADVERLLGSRHLLPLRSGDVRAMTGQRDEDNRDENRNPSHSRRHRCAIGICRPLPNALVETRMVGAPWLRLNSFPSTIFRMRTTRSRSKPAAAMASTSKRCSM
ncbi:MAG: hypothetical protein QOC81_4022, partial [Thermoanaerobaculia bacterium]|nr:hypothetical protein [Thermoanaerobaculia bacterium]